MMKHIFTTQHKQCTLKQKIIRYVRVPNSEQRQFKQELLRQMVLFGWRGSWSRAKLDFDACIGRHPVSKEIQEFRSSNLNIKND